MSTPPPPAALEAAALPDEPYPLRHLAQRALAAAAVPPAGWQPLGYGTADYLALVRAICAVFQSCQDERGAILDPYAGEEKQYATPCYAVAAALVALDGRPPAGVWGAARRPAAEPPQDPQLLESAARAQDHALRSLAVDKNTAQNHADFFAPLVVMAYQLLAPFVAGERAARWLAELRSIDPESTYRDTFTWQAARGRPGAVHNWNVVAIAGEMLRYQAGAGDALPWVQRYLEYQLGTYCDLEWGLYRDPNCPLPYDLFPRHHLGYALAGAPQAVGPHLPKLQAWLARGEWTSALTQTASGGIPPGWRSSEHLWNDAALVALAEVAAARHARAGLSLTRSAGLQVAAGLFRRVATLAFRSMLHWQRPSGELHVVKNHQDPSGRHGFEGYSFHSNYGLYPAAMLATAILFGDGASQEAPAPVETGGYVVRYPDPFHRLVATCAGQSPAGPAGLTLNFDLDADGHYDVSGLNSVRRLHAHPLLGPACGIPAHPRYHLPQAPGAACGPGLSWTDPSGAPASLAGLRPRGVELHVERQEPGEVVFSLRYLVEAAGCESITTRFRLGPASIEAEEHFVGAPSTREALAFVWPFPLDDGRDQSRVQVQDGALHVQLGATTQRLSLQDGALTLAGLRLAYRNGAAGVARGPVNGVARWRLEYS